MEAQRNLIIFAGAGASRGVSEKYPTALDFLRQLPQVVTNLPLYKLLHLHFTEQQPNDAIDIETILWELGRLVDTLRELAEQPRFLVQAIRTGRIQAELGLQHLNPNVADQARHMRSLANQ